MNDKDYETARMLKNNIAVIEQDISRIDKVLLDFNSYRSNITFQKEGDSGFSFGTKKYNIKNKLKAILETVRGELELELESQKNKFERL